MKDEQNELKKKIKMVSLNQQYNNKNNNGRRWKKTLDYADMYLELKLLKAF